MLMNRSQWWRDDETKKTWWIHQPWLQGRKLDRNSVLSYFKLSHFYDKSCNNAILEINNRTEENLVHMTGIEYVVDVPPGENNTPLVSSTYVIRKQFRQSPTDVRLLALYLIIGQDNKEHFLTKGGVYALPDLYSVLEHNIVNTAFFLEKAVDSLRKLVKLNNTYGTSLELGVDEKIVLDNETDENRSINELPMSNDVEQTPTDYKSEDEFQFQKKYEQASLDTLGLDPFAAYLFTQTMDKFKTDLL